MSQSPVIRSEDSRMGEKRGMKALEAWCKRVTDGYKGVSIENMTTSWRDGLAFCAIIHHFRPDLIDFDSLDKNDIYQNNELAFRTAEHHLGIPALLDAEDMVEYEVPDRLSILTYLSQFYQTFTAHGSSPTRSISKRPATTTDRGARASVAESPPSKVVARLGRREPCTKCGLPVFIAERLLINGHLYHRTCFRCARCQHQLSVANCYETEGGEYCCETCPDEVLADKPNVENQDDLDMIGHAGPEDEYSADFESAVEESFEQIVREAKEQPVIKFSQAHSEFMSSQLSLSDSRNLDSSHGLSDNEEKVPAPLVRNQNVVSSLPLQYSSKLRGLTSDHDTGSSKNVNKFSGKVNTGDSSVVHSVSSFEDEDKIVANYFSTKSDISHTAHSSALSGNDSKKDVPINVSSSNRKNSVHITDDQLITANDSTSHVNSQDNLSTKDLDSSEVPASSIVKMRLQLFEKGSPSEDSSKASKTRSNKRYALNQNDSINEDDTVSTQSHISGAVHKDLTEKNVCISEVKSRNEDGLGKPVDKITILTEDVSSICDVDTDEQAFQGIYEDSLKTESHLDFDDLSVDDKMINSSLTVPKDDLELDKSDTPKAVSPVTRTMEVDTMQSSIKSKMEEENITYPKELNPFGDDEDEDGGNTARNSPSGNTKQGTNPFGSSDDDEDDDGIEEEINKVAKPVPVARKTAQRIIEAPKVNLNPFWTDGEEPSSEDEATGHRPSAGEKPPVPLPRTVIGVSPEPSPMPRKSLMAETSDKFGSVSSLSSLNSSTGGTSHRKKKPAPTPPRAQDLFLGTSSTPSAMSATSSRTSSPTPSSGHSPKTTPRHRKKSRPAPPPPTSLTFAEAKLLVSDRGETMSPSGTAEWEPDKNKKDVANRNRQSQRISTVSSSPVSPNEQQLSIGPNKSTYGQWKRKKGPAPPRPVPQRRQIRAIPMKEVKRELDDIEVQQQELERQGVTLEKTIRDKFDQQPNPEDDSSMTPDIEDLVLQLFELVNEKNELFRRQAELMYLRRQQRLEEEHADLEYQIRCLMLRPEHTKTDSDKAREEELIQRLVEVVERRNEIVECLEMDRIREAEEDRSIHSRLGMFSKGKTLCPEEIVQSKGQSGKKQKKKNKKDKDKHSNKKTAKPGLDADKDIDEVEAAVPKHTKEKKTKRKWF